MVKRTKIQRPGHALLWALAVFASYIQIAHFKFGAFLWEQPTATVSKKKQSRYNESSFDPLAVNISFQLMKKNQHPHMGARDENGNYGYVHDETNLRRHVPRFNTTGLDEQCLIRDAEWEAIQRIQVANASGTPKILCAVYSVEMAHHKIPYIRETWGHRCDGFLVGSNKTDKALDAVDIVHKGKEEKKNLFQKVRSMWSYIYDNYYEDYDFFHMNGDDTMLIVENLRNYLDSEEIQTAAYGGHPQMQVPLYLGSTYAKRGKLNKLYQTGGPGYTLNKAALKLLVTKGLEKYFRKTRGPEDVTIGDIFRLLGVEPFRTTDSENSERYHHYTPGKHFTGDEPGCILTRYTNGLNYTKGRNHSSVHSISFHYVTTENMRRLHALLYGLCDE